MARWIVFDESTASELRSRLPQEAVFEAPGRSPVEYALAAPRSLVTVLPLPLKNASAIAVFRPERTRTAAPIAPSLVRATGFLGLSDELVLTEEIQEKKKWWKRFGRE